MIVNTDNLITVYEVAKIYDKTTKWVYDQIAKGVFVEIKVGGKILIDKTTLKIN